VYPVARLLVRAALVFAVAAAAASAVEARPKNYGPGPFDRISINSRGVTFVVRQSAANSVLFAGSVSLKASSGAALAGFSSSPSVQNNGLRLVQNGNSGGVPIADYFAEGAVRLVEIKNGGGATTYLVLRRSGNELAVERIDRGDLQPLQIHTQDFADVDLRADAEMSFRLAKQARGPKARKLVVALALPSSLPDASLVFVTGQAAGEGGNSGFIPFTQARPEDRAVFLTADVAPDVYNVTFTYNATLRPHPSIEQRLNITYSLPQTVTVDKGAFVQATIPEPPALRETQVTIDGIDQIVGLAGQSRFISATFSHETEPMYCGVSADLSFVTSFNATLLLPEGEYRATAHVDLADIGPSNAGAGSIYDIGHATAGGLANLRIPEVVRVTGTLLDPSLSLAPSPGPDNSIPRHSVFIRPSNLASSTYFGQARLTGFQRGYKAYAPRGQRVTLQGSFQVRLGDTPPAADARENASGNLLITTATQPIDLDSDVVVDLSIPALPPYVTLRGRVLRADGKPAKGAYVQATAGSVINSTAGFTAIITADANGEFRLRALPGDDYRLYIYDYGN
jgi:hypothetical protein